MKITAIKNYIIITIGLFITALGWTAFLIPAKLLGGGASGLATLFYFATGFPVGITVLIVNAFLILIAMKTIGTGYGIRTIYGVIVLSFFLTLLQFLVSEPIIQDSFMAAILGGALSGAGIGIVFSQGGSSGGTDIIASIIVKYKNYSMGKVILVLDLLIITSSYFIFGSLQLIVYGYVVMAVNSYVIDLVLEGTRQSIQMFIFSQNNELIAEKIGNTLGRGITFIPAKGWFTKENREIVMVIVRKFEVGQVFQMIKEVDNDAFISVASVMGVYGKGFEKLK